MAHEDDYKQSSHMPSFVVVICQHKKKRWCVIIADCCVTFEFDLSALYFANSDTP